MAFLIFVLSLIGLWISVYFTGVYYKWFHPNVFWIPQVCQLKESTCMMIIDTPRAKLFGIPNSVFGIGLYAYLILSLFVYFPPAIALRAFCASTFREELDVLLRKCADPPRFLAGTFFVFLTAVAGFSCFPD